MTTYAILGATGQTGSEIVRALLPTSAHLNIYARSLSRLESQFPSLATSSNVTLFIGDLSDTAVLTACLSTADVVFSAVATNQNQPGLSIAQQTALAIVRALEPRRTGQCPTVVFLSSGAIHPFQKAKTGIAQMPRWAMHWVISHVYDDLEKGIELLEANPWIPLVVASASGLVHDVAHPVVLTDVLDDMSQLISYADLARGMIMMGDEGSRWRGKHVGLSVNDGQPIGGNPALLMRYLLPNLLAMVCPPLWWLGKDYWPK
jgi:hypothetical protein